MRPALLLVLALLTSIPCAFAAQPAGRTVKPEAVVVLARMPLPWPDPATLALPEATVRVLQRVENMQGILDQLREARSAALRQASGEAEQDVSRAKAVETTLGPQLRHAEDNVVAARTQAIAALRQGTVGAEASFILGELERGAAQARQDLRMEAYEEELRALETCQGHCETPKPPELNLQAARLAWKAATESRMPPVRAMAWYALGYAAEDAGQSSEATAAYQMAQTDARPALADELHLRLGNLALDDGQEAEGKKHFAAIAAPDKQRLAWARLTLAYLQRDRCLDVVRSAAAYRAIVAEAGELDAEVRHWEAQCVADPYSGLTEADFAKLGAAPDALLKAEIERQRKGFTLPTTARQAAVLLAERCVDLSVRREDPEETAAAKISGTLQKPVVQGMPEDLAVQVAACMARRADKLPKLKGKIDGPIVVLPVRVP